MLPPAVLAVLAAFAAAPTAAAAAQPHLVFLLADDFGHYDSSVTNPDAPTPTLKRLAQEGIVLDRHYVYQFCSPTRTSFLSGRLPHHVNEENRPATELGGVDLRMKTIAENLKSVGYATLTAGKWHGGAMLSGQLPTQRGFDAHLGYLNGNEDHYTQYFESLSATDLWEGSAPAYNKTGTYGDEMFVGLAVDTIDKHDASTPLFLYLAFQVTHIPLQVPASYINTSRPEIQQVYYGMISYLDEGVENVTAALKRRGMWENTIVVFSADNGGECDKSYGNNYPLRGAKFTDFEGGVRASAFVSGGSSLIPKARRGSTSTAWVHICDWFATFASLAGADPSDTPGAGVPASDGVNVWPAITSDAPSPRTEILVSSAGSGTLISVINGTAYKVMTETKKKHNIWTPKDFPLSPLEYGKPCDPCVFDLDADTAERTDLSLRLPDVTSELLARAKKHIATKWQTGDDGYQGKFTECTRINKYIKKHKGFLGPLCYPAGV